VKQHNIMNVNINCTEWNEHCADKMCSKTTDKLTQ